MTRVHGSVTDAHGSPLAGASVYVISAPMSMPDIALLTDAQGQFTLTAPVAGHYTIGVRAGNGTSAQTDFDAQDEKEISIKLQLKP